MLNRLVLGRGTPTTVHRRRHYAPREPDGVCVPARPRAACTRFSSFSTMPGSEVPSARLVCRSMHIRLPGLACGLVPESAR